MAAVAMRPSSPAGILRSPSVPSSAVRRFDAMPTPIRAAIAARRVSFGADSIALIPHRKESPESVAAMAAALAAMAASTAKPAVATPAEATVAAAATEPQECVTTAAAGGDIAAPSFAAAAVAAVANTFTPLRERLARVRAALPNLMMHRGGGGAATTSATTSATAPPQPSPAGVNLGAAVAAAAAAAPPASSHASRPPLRPRQADSGGGGGLPWELVAAIAQRKRVGGGDSGPTSASAAAPAPPTLLAAADGVLHASAAATAESGAAAAGPSRAGAASAGRPSAPSSQAAGMLAELRRAIEPRRRRLSSAAATVVAQPPAAAPTDVRTAMTPGHQPQSSNATPAAVASGGHLFFSPSDPVVPLSAVPLATAPAAGSGVAGVPTVQRHLFFDGSADEVDIGVITGRRLRPSPPAHTADGGAAEATPPRPMQASPVRSALRIQPRSAARRTGDAVASPGAATRGSGDRSQRRPRHEVFAEDDVHAAGPNSGSGGEAVMPLAATPSPTTSATLATARSGSRSGNKRARRSTNAAEEPAQTMPHASSASWDFLYGVDAAAETEDESTLKLQLQSAAVSPTVLPAQSSEPSASPAPSAVTATPLPASPVRVADGGVAVELPAQPQQQPLRNGSPACGGRLVGATPSPSPPASSVWDDEDDPRYHRRLGSVLYPNPGARLSTVIEDDGGEEEMERARIVAEADDEDEANTTFESDGARRMSIASGGTLAPRPSAVSSKRRRKTATPRKPSQRRSQGDGDEDDELSSAAQEAALPSPLRSAAAAAVAPLDATPLPVATIASPQKVARGQADSAKSRPRGGGGADLGSATTTTALATPVSTTPSATAAGENTSGAQRGRRSAGSVPLTGAPVDAGDGTRSSAPSRAAAAAPDAAGAMSVSETAVSGGTSSRKRGRGTAMTTPTPRNEPQPSPNPAPPTSAAVSVLSRLGGADKDGEDRASAHRATRTVPPSSAASNDSTAGSCGVCGTATTRRGNPLLLCDACDASVHVKCAGLQGVPEGDWFCASCAAAGSKGGRRRSAPEEAPHVQHAPPSETRVADRATAAAINASQMTVAAINASQMTVAAIDASQMTVAQLRAELGARGLSTSGLKAALVARLQAAL